VTARKDWANCLAKATVEVDGKPLLHDVPVTFLLFLEKQLTDMRTLVDRLPVLDEAEQWNFDENAKLYKTDAITTHRTRKVQKPIVMYDATPEHPAQTQLIVEDVIVGHWKLTKHSGALPKGEKDKLIARIEKLLQGVKQAREAANGLDEVKTPAVGDTVFGYLLGA
jgi:hypothetical protein